MPVSVASTNDIPALVTLLNSAYRGDFSKKGWTTEADLISGDIRTDEASVQDLLQIPGAVFLKHENADGQLVGCVFLQKMGSRLYLGMLSVSPLTQAQGIGKQILAAAVSYAIASGCTSIFMKVISARPELIAWYERHGYVFTGEKESFPEDGRFGKPLVPIEFHIMEKIIQTQLYPATP